MSLAALLLLAAAAQAPPAAPADQPQPPEDMIDFLGRRSECLAMREMADGEDPAASSYFRPEWLRLRCGAIGAEEAELRQWHAGDPEHIEALDRAPERFEYGLILAAAFDGVGGILKRLDLTGEGPRGRAFRITFDKEASGGRATLVRAYLDGRSAGEVTLDNRRFEHIDLRSVFPYFSPSGDALSVQVTYGYGRDYCFVNDPARPALTFHFERGGVRVTNQPFTNCQVGAERLDPAQLGPGE